MGRISLSTLLRAALIAAGVMATFESVATAGSITFLSPRQVAVRHSGGTLLRGGIKSMTDDEVVVNTTGGDKSVALSTVSSVIASDGSFKFLPMQETLDEFLAKSSSLRGVTILRDNAPGGAAGSTDTKTISTVSDGYAKSIGMQSPGSPRGGSSSGGFVQSDGFGGASQRPQQLARLEAPNIPELDPAVVRQLEEQRKQAELASKTPTFGVPGASTPTGPASSDLTFGRPAGQEIMICANPKCRKEVPGAKYGDKCPHCGMVWAKESAGDLLAQNPPNGSSTPSNGSPTPVSDPKNPFNKGPVQAAPGPAPAPMAVQQGQPPGAAAPVVGQAQGFSLETMPWWGKLVGFGASVVVLMWLWGRR